MQLVKEFYEKTHVKNVKQSKFYVLCVLSEILGTFLLPTHFNFKYKYYISLNYIIIKSGTKSRDKVIIPTITLRKIIPITFF